MINEEIVHVNGYPKKLVIFLHGYIDSAPALDKKICKLVEDLADVAIHIPQAPGVCEIHENKRQWYSMHRFDPDDARKFVPTLEECVSIYDRMGLGLAEAFAYLKPYIENLLAEYNLDAKDLYLCGFSQGAMLALYTSLMWEEKIGGCISFSGILTPHRYLLKHNVSSPHILLIHGNADNLVRFEVQDFTKHCLEQMGCRVDVAVIDGGQHRVTEEGLEYAAEFIKGHYSDAKENGQQLVKKII